MRYIDIDDLVLPTGWSEEASAATLAVLAGAHASQFDAIWQDVKPRLSTMLDYKCWFCESPVTRSDNAVDHFRPKRRVSDAAQPHHGYRWLTFAFVNFRYACTFCNSRRIDVQHGTAGGKADRFPLVDEGTRVYEVVTDDLDFEDLLATVVAERPSILDPCAWDDWRLLGCKRENGKPCPTDDDPNNLARVEASIDVYHLDHEPTCKQRHTVAGMFLRIVRQAKARFLSIDPDDPKSIKAWQDLAREIRRMIGRAAPYSGEMRFLLGGQRSDEQPWVTKLLGDE